MTSRQFSQLCEMLEKNRVRLTMSYETHKKILGVLGSIDPIVWKDLDMLNKFDGITIVHDNTISVDNIKFVPTFTPSIGNGFTIKLDF